EASREVIRRVVRRGGCAHQTDALSGSGQRGKQRQRLQPVQIVRWGIRRDELAVDDEDEVEFRLLCKPRVFDIPVDIDTGVTGNLWIQPTQLVTGTTGSSQDCPELNLTLVALVCHVSDSLSSRFRR